MKLSTQLEALLPRLSPKAIQTLKTLAQHNELFYRYPGSGHYPKWFAARHGGKPVSGIFTPTLDKLEDLGFCEYEKLEEKSDSEPFGVGRQWITKEGRQAVDRLKT